MEQGFRSDQPRSTNTARGTATTSAGRTPGQGPWTCCTRQPIAPPAVRRSATAAFLGNQRDVAGYAQSLEWVLGIGLVLILIAGLTSLKLPRPPKPTNS